MLIRQVRTSALLCALTLIALVAPAGAAAAPDPVLSAIATAQKSRTITYAQARAHRATWLASARSARTAPTAARRREIAAVRAYTVALAKRRQLTSERLEPVLLSVKATTYIMGSRRAFPRHEQIVTIPGELAVFKYYSARGVQWQPFESFKRGMELVNVPVPQTQLAREYADRMISLSVQRAGATTWEYYFPFGGPSTPWISSMSQALATEFFHRVATQLDLVLRYPDAEYIAADAPSVSHADVDRMRGAAAGAMRAFQLPTRRGGVMASEGAGRWYLMYPFAPAQRILNGHLQVLVNLSRYATEAPSAAAQSVVDAGVRAVLPLMSRFDTGGWSRYQYGQEANLNYHDFQTSQLKKLGGRGSTVPEREAFQGWYERFAAYRVTAPTITISATPPAPLIPVIDGYRDTTSLTWTTDKRSRDTIVISNEAGTPVRRIVTSGGTGTHSITWNGRNARGAIVAAGRYSAVMDSVDIIGNRRRTVITHPIIVLEDTAPPTARAVRIIPRGARRTTVRVAAYDTGSGYIDAIVEVRGRELARTRGGRAGSIDVSVPRAAAAVRTYVLKLVDSSGNTTVVPLHAPVAPAPVD